MLDALVHGKNRQIARVREAARAEHPAQVAQDGRRAVGRDEDAVHEIRAREVQQGRRDPRRLVVEE